MIPITTLLRLLALVIYLLELFQRVITISLETMKVVRNFIKIRNLEKLDRFMKLTYLIRVS